MTEWSLFVSKTNQPFNITVIQVYAPTSNAEEAEAEWFYEDLQDILGISELKRTGVGELNSDDLISTTVGKNPLQKME